MAGQDGSAGVFAPRFTGAVRDAALATLLIAFTMDVVDTTIVNVAIPAIQHDLGATGVAIQWVAAGYSLAFALLLLTGGRLGDLVGYKRMFLIGMGGFTTASILCGLAVSPGWLIAARLVQGGAAALMGPQVLALVQLLYAPLERVRILAAFGVIGGLAAVLGPILGGVLIQADIASLGWRLIFFINAPLGVAGLLAGFRYLPDGRSSHALRLDLGGAAIAATALFFLLFPLIEGRQWGWPWWCGAMMLAALALGVVFVAHLRRRTARVGSALIAPELFKDRVFCAGLAGSLVFAMATSGLLFVLTLTLQKGLGYSAFQTAIIHVPFALGVMVGISQIGRRALPSLGGMVVLIGAVVMAAGVGLFAAAAWAATHPLWLIVAALLIAGVGMGVIAGPLTPIALARVDTGHAGIAGGLLGAVQQLGGAMGTAAIGTIYLSSPGPAVRSTGLPLATVVMIALLASLFTLGLTIPRQIFRRADDPIRGSSTKIAARARR